MVNNTNKILKQIQQDELEFQKRRKHIEDLMCDENYLEKMSELNQQTNKSAKKLKIKTINYRDCKENKDGDK